MTTANLAAPGAAPTNPSGNSNPNAVPGTAPNEPKFLTPEEVDARIQEALITQRNSIFAEIRRSQKQTPAPPSEPQEPNPAPRQSAADKELAKQLETLKKRHDGYVSRLKGETIRRIGAELGVPADRLEPFEVYYAAKYGSGLRYNEELDKVEMVDALDQATDLKAEIGKFLKTAQGSLYIAAPSTGGVPRGSNAPASSGEQDPMKMTPEQRKAWRKNAFQ